jgi:hypothetical protein
VGVFLQCGADHFAHGLIIHPRVGSVALIEAH